MNFLNLKIPPFLQFILAAILIYQLNQLYPNFSIPFQQHKAIAIILVTMGLLVGLLAVREFKKAKTTVDPVHPDKAKKLVTGGIYRISRNPMYLGLLFTLLGVVVYFTNPLGLIAPLLFVLYMNRFQITIEENTLLTHFGTKYVKYTQKVSRWLLFF